MQAIACVLAILWGTGMGIIWFLSPVPLFSAMGFMMVLSGYLMIAPLFFVVVKFSKITAGVTALINTLWIIFASLPVPSWVLLILFSPWNRAQATAWLVSTLLLDVLSVVIILIAALFFMEGYILEEGPGPIPVESSGEPQDTYDGSEEEDVEEESQGYTGLRSRSRG